MESALTREMVEAVIERRDGKFYWRSRSQGPCSEAFNKNNAGRETGIRTCPGGYVRIRILGHFCLFHRVVWLLETGEWPDGEIDHINGDRADNRMENLRLVDRSINARNMGRRSDNKSGVAGVHWNSRKRKWDAAICVRGRRTNLGSFPTLEAASAARSAASAQHGFTARHGK